MRSFSQFAALCVFALLAMMLSHAPSRASYIVRFHTEVGSYDVRLFNTATPGYTANLMRYIVTDRYDGTFFHRSLPGFVLQGGGYYFVGPSTVDDVVSDAEIKNEPGIPSLRGTISMAKPNTHPDSATNEWFINLDDNPHLDLPPAGPDFFSRPFTVFGRVLGDGMNVVDAISQIPTFDIDGSGRTFDDVPLELSDGTTFQERVVNVLDVEVMNPLAGDYNFDGKVSAADYTVWRDLLGSTDSLWADGDDSGTVDPGDLEVWKMNYGKQIIDGDYNFDGKVSAADYTIWRDQLGSSTSAEADGNGDGQVNAADYLIWQDNFGAVTRFGDGSGASAGDSQGVLGVPEPSSVLILGFLALAWSGGRRLRRRVAKN
jgi:cyclophilin family peptidyl-prolyl cis-trans isomerase